MDLNNFFIFDDAALEFCNSLGDSTTNNPTEVSNDAALSPTYHGLSEDSGFDTTIPYYSDNTTLLGKASPTFDLMSDNASQALTLLTAPADPTFKFIAENSQASSDDTLVHAVPDIQFKSEPMMDTSSMLDTSSLLDASSMQEAPETERIPYSSKSTTGKVELKIMSQPSRNHRARYRTEGSRGAVKDRGGRSFPIVKLTGYNKTPVKLRCYIGHDKRPGEPHLFYQVSKIVGKNVTPCQVTKIEGIKVVEIDLLPSSNMQAVINCIGIVKERNFDVQRKATNLRKKHLYAEGGQQKGGMERRSTACTLVFGCQIPESNEILQVVSDPINCAQLLGCPEVHKISSTRADVKGGEEVFIIGKNFTRDTKLIWECGEAWYQITEPEPEFLNQNHLICRVPPFTALDKVTVTPGEAVDVTFKIKCGDKYSEPYMFAFNHEATATVEIPTVAVTDFWNLTK